jgi:hypothetical protein
MKKSLIEKLMRLFDQKLSTLSSSASKENPTHQEHPHEDDPAEIVWGDIHRLEHNTVFIKDSHPASLRVLCHQERMKLSRQSLKFLQQLIHLDIIGEHTFELIMNQLLFSDSLVVSLQETKWVVNETLASSLDETQQAFLDLILYQQEDRLIPH